MDEDVVVALISAAAVVTAALIGLVPVLLPVILENRSRRRELRERKAGRRPGADRPPVRPFRSTVSRRRRFLVAGALVAVIVVGIGTIIRVTGEACAGAPVPLEINSSVEKDDILREIADDYNADADRCATVSVHGTSSGTAMHALTGPGGSKGWDAARTGTPQPQVWTPTDSLWERIFRRRLTLPDGESPPVVKSPLVIAMPRAMADTLRRSRPRVGWELLRLAGKPGVWGSPEFGQPDWGEKGRFVLAKDDPTRSTSGLAATVAAFSRVAGDSEELRPADVDEHRPVFKAVRDVEAGTPYHSDDAMKFLKDLADHDTAGKALSYISAVVLEEQLLYRYNTGDHEYLPKGFRPTQPLVSLLPEDGTLMMDHPYVILPGLREEQRKAAEDFLRYLREPAQQRLFTAKGFRHYRSERLDPGVAKTIGLPGDPAAQTPSQSLQRPDAAVLEKILRVWPSLKKKARILLVLDVSGSMNDSADGRGTGRGDGRTKLDAVKDAAAAAVELLHPDDEVGLWTFSSPPPGGGEPYRQWLPPQRLGDAAKLVATIRALPPTEGDTALYHTVRKAEQYLAGHRLPGGINAVVLMTDGKNVYPRDDDRRRLLTDVDARKLEVPVPIFGIAFGPAADYRTLKEIAVVSQGSAYDATDPKLIDKAFIDILSRFG